MDAGGSQRPIGFAVEMNGYNSGDAYPPPPPPASYPQNGAQPPPIGFEGVASANDSTYQPYPSLDNANGVKKGQNVSFDNPTYEMNELRKEEDETRDRDDDDMDQRDQKEVYGSKDQSTQMFFKDGVRRIDYVLAYRVDTSERGEKMAAKRQRFEDGLLDEGLDLELEDEEDSQDGKTFFLKVHAPWEFLTRYAEMMKIKMPIRENDIAEEEKRSCWAKMPNPFEIESSLLPEEGDYYTAAFNRDRIDQFIIPDDKDLFFSNAQRSRIAYEILSRQKYEDSKNKFGIKKLLANRSYVAAFPLHEGKYDTGHSILTGGGADNNRQLLYEVWGRPGRFAYFQPLDFIRTYFGEKIAIYFTWLGFYTAALIPASIVGLACFIYGIATLDSNIPSEEVCSDQGALMCPLCDRCELWQLNTTSCDYSKASYLFDNSATVFFAIFMSLWATLFLEFWKRKQYTIAWDWDVADFENELQPPRPEYEARVKSKRLNPINQMFEPFLPFWNKLARWLASGSVILFMLFVVLGALLGVIIYRTIILSVLYSSEGLDEAIRKNAKIVTTVTAATLNLLAIMVLSRLYLKIAVWLTDLECPRTQTEYDDSFTFKMFLFMFVNYYSSLIYIAFFKGSLSNPKKFGKDSDQLFGYRPEECDPAGCLIELSIQLIIIMVGKQSFNNVNEFLVPKLMNWWRRRNSRTVDSQDRTVYTRWEQDFDLAEMPPKGLFDEYLEMVIQYGFVTMFVAAFPLAPLLALINNVIEIRLDGYKFITQLRRPLAMRAQDIGVWYNILHAISIVAVIFNGFVIAYTSDFIPRLVYRYGYSPDSTLNGYIDQSLSTYRIVSSGPLNGTLCRYRGYFEPPGDPEREYKETLQFWHIFAARLAFVVVFEHFVFFLTGLISYMVPDVPESVAIQEMREDHLAKEALYSRELQKSKDRKKRIHED